MSDYCQVAARYHNDGLLPERFRRLVFYKADFQSRTSRHSSGRRWRLAAPQPSVWDVKEVLPSFISPWKTFHISSILDFPCTVFSRARGGVQSSAARSLLCRSTPALLVLGCFCLLCELCSVAWKVWRLCQISHSWQIRGGDASPRS